MLETFKILTLALVILVELLRVGKEWSEIKCNRTRMGWSHHVWIILYFAPPTYYSLEFSHILRLI
jgi:hypothetical protein